MKIFLRNTLTGRYYRGPSQWTAHPSQALDLKQMSQATQLAVGSRLKNVDFFLCAMITPTTTLLCPLTCPVLVVIAARNRAPSI